MRPTCPPDGVFLRMMLTHAGDGIGAVLGRRAILQHLDALDRGHRNEVEIRRRATLIGPAEHREVAGGVATLAVDEHERVIRAQAAQACGQRQSRRCRRRTPAR